MHQRIKHNGVKRSFASCESCQQHREAMGMWGAEKTKKKVKGEAIGYGMLTEQAKIDLEASMIRQGRFTREERDRGDFYGL